MTTILLFVLLLGFLVFVHELGHFLTAKWHGIQTDEFGFGFPPRLGGFYKDSTTGKWRFVFGNRDVATDNTVYSINWIPLGGFVKIKGEDGADDNDPNSFASRSAWVRIQVMAAGVVMNFLLAWILISIVFMLGLPQPIEESQKASYPDARIQILDVKAGTPAAAMGLQPGDILLSLDGKEVESLGAVSEHIQAHKGEVITVFVDRFGKEMTLSGTPRLEAGPHEGALGISYSMTATVEYGFFESFAKGAVAVYSITLAILEAFGKMIGGLFGAEKTNLEVTGPVGIVYLTKQMSDLGLPYLLQFAALLSINLGIINILPIPALDGGRILFVLIEKIKRSPVSQRTEGMIHQIGFILLLLLMLFVTIKDFNQFQIFQKILNIF